MYTPTAFAENNPEILAEFLREHSFATLISHSDGEMMATHLPILLESQNGKPFQLLGHMARANSQWRLAEGNEVLVIFQGPHAYISPRWYAERNTVPTWNYTAVHVYGTFRLLADLDTRELLVQSVVEYEAGRKSPWTLEENDPELFEKLLPQIVGFRVEISRLEGKWKLNQNHSTERRLRVMEQLKLESNANGHRVAELMEKTLPNAESD